MEKQDKIAASAVSTEIAENNDQNDEEKTASHLKRDKVYKYEKNGKTITVRRKWTNYGDKQLKQEALAEYFANIDEIDRTKTIQTLYKEYNNNHDLKISYSMFYKKYAEHFGPRRA